MHVTVYLKWLKLSPSRTFALAPVGGPIAGRIMTVLGRVRNGGLDVFVRGRLSCQSAKPTRHQIPSEVE